MMMKDTRSMTQPAVNIQGLTREFSGRAVLKDIDLTLQTGEFLAVLGPSGTGKSTLLRILAGLDTGAKGTVDVPTARSVMFQDARLLPWRTIDQNILLGAEGRRRADALAILDEVGLNKDFAKRWPGTLSGGEAQRVALARALIREPGLLLLDEPFGALDALTRIKMQELLGRVHRRHRSAVVLVTHDVEEAILLAERVIVLSGGKIMTDVQVDVDGPRHRTDPRIVSLRARLLRDLGVDEDEAPPDRHAIRATQ